MRGDNSLYLFGYYIKLDTLSEVIDNYRHF